jgi:hypothetical protein
MKTKTSLTMLCLALTGCATTAGSSTTAFYPLEELQALDVPEGQGELLSHALEVAPSHRNDTWRGLVERAAIATVDEVEVKDTASAEHALEQLRALPARYPFLKRSTPWLARRADVAVKSLGWVSSGHGSREWVLRVLEFARTDAVTPHLAQRLAEEVVLKQLIPSTTLPFFELALERDGATVCDSPTLQKVVLEVASDGSDFTAATSRCWKQVEGELTAAAKKSETRTGKLKLCAAMAAHAESPAVKAACAE